MKLLKTLFNFYINSSIHVALAVLSLVRISEFYLNIQPQPRLYGFVFFGCITGYNFVKYAALAGLHHRHLTKSLKSIQVFSLLCFFMLIYFALQFDRIFWLNCIPLAVLTLFYAAPPYPNYRNLRRIPSLKIFIIAVVWAGVTGYLPAVASGVLNPEVLFICLQRILLVIALMIPFEIRDLKYDSKKLETLPQLLGIKKTKLLGFGLLVIFTIVEFLLETNELSLIPGSISIAGITGYAIFKSSTKQHKYFASFFVEAIPVLWYLFSLSLLKFAG